MKIPKHHRPRRNAPKLDALSVGPTAKYSDFTEWRSADLGAAHFAAQIREGTSVSNKKPFVAVMLSPKTLLPAAVSLEGNYVLIHDLPVRLELARGYYGGSNEEREGCQRQHAAPGRKERSTAEGGFGPLIYYGGALAAGVKGDTSCIYSNDGRTGAASAAWDKFKSMKLAYREKNEPREVEIERDAYLASYQIHHILAAWFSDNEEVLDDPDGTFDDDPESEQYLTTTYTLDIPLRELADAIFDQLPADAREYDAEFCIFRRGVGGTCGEDQEIEITITLTREWDEESGTFTITDHDWHRKQPFDFYARWVEMGESDGGGGDGEWADIMQADTILRRSGLVVWTNPQYADLILDGQDVIFTAPPVTVLAHMNPTAISAGWFARIFAACAAQSDAPHEYLTQLHAEIVEVGVATPRSPMLQGWRRAVGALLIDNDDAANASIQDRLAALQRERTAQSRVNGRAPKMNVIPLDTWLRQAAAIPDIGQE